MLISDALSHSNEPVLSHFASIFYCELFQHTDKFFQQEVIGELVTKVNGGSGEFAKATAIKTLSQLAFKHTEQVYR